MDKEIHQDRDISLREAILRLREYIITLLKAWKFILFMGILGAVILVALNFNKKPLYKAELSFMLNEDDGGGLGSFSNILGQFGLGIGGSESNLDKIIELSKTRLITQGALFDTISISNNHDLLVNHIIRDLQHRNKWNTGRIQKLLGKDSLNLKNYVFENGNVNDFDLIDNKALKKIHRYFVGKDKLGGAFESAYSDVSGILYLSITTGDQHLSIATVNKLIDELRDFYDEQTIESQKEDFKLIKSKYDSINSRLGQVQYSLAKIKDTNQGLISKRDQVNEKRLKTEEQKLFIMIGEMEKQYQLAQLTMENNSEYIQVIDRPLAPLRPVNKGRLYYLVLGGLLGGILSSAWVFLSKVYKDIIMSDDQYSSESSS